MGYVIAGILVLLIVSAGVTFMVLNATRRQRQASAASSDYGEGTPGTEAAIVAPDDNTPLGDTDQHHGEQTREGSTVSGEAAGDGGRDAKAPDGDQGGRRGAGEGDRRVVPESERLADRQR